MLENGTPDVKVFNSQKHPVACCVWVTYSVYVMCSLKKNDGQMLPEWIMNVDLLLIWH